MLQQRILRTLRVDSPTIYFAATSWHKLRDIVENYIMMLVIGDSSGAGEIMTRTTLLVLAVWICCLTPVEAGCRVGGFIFAWGSDTSANMLVTGGSTCAINLRAGSRSAFESIRINSRPAHGTAGSSGSYSVAYRPTPGFRGTDSFTFTVRGTGGQAINVVKSTTIRVNVTVQ